MVMKTKQKRHTALTTILLVLFICIISAATSHASSNKEKMINIRDHNSGFDNCIAVIVKTNIANQLLKLNESMITRVLLLQGK